ncbi:MAG: bacterial transcriptional activator domain-containing protein [Chloroflexota bacterium]|nr:bacterial transcriptional activator domain-containing protein [Chloroflexota bacterium]
MDALAAAIGGYHGAFLTGFSLAGSIEFEEWVTARREGLQQQALGALAGLIAYHERRGDLATALGYARRYLELDTWREEIHRQVIARNPRQHAPARFVLGEGGSLLGQQRDGPPNQAGQVRPLVAGAADRWVGNPVGWRACPARAAPGACPTVPRATEPNGSA